MSLWFSTTCLRVTADETRARVQLQTSYIVGFRFDIGRAHLCSREIYFVRMKYCYPRMLLNSGYRSKQEKLMSCILQMTAFRSILSFIQHIMTRV
jgi:hypothetical protein